MKCGKRVYLDLFQVTHVGTITENARARPAYMQSGSEECDRDSYAKSVRGLQGRLRDSWVEYALVEQPSSASIIKCVRVGALIRAATSKRLMVS